MQTAAPALFKLHRRARSLELAWADGRRVDLPCEYLRVFSPSAELRGHGLPEPMLLGGKREVNIVRIEPRSEEHTSELQSLMRLSYAVFCLKKKHKHKRHLPTTLMNNENNKRHNHSTTTN